MNSRGASTKLGFCDGEGSRAKGTSAQKNQLRRDCMWLIVRYANSVKMAPGNGEKNAGDVSAVGN